MKSVLVIGNRVPVPAKDGGAIATLRLLKELTYAGYQVDFLTLNTDKHHASDAQIKEGLSFLRNVYTIPINTRVSAFNALYNLLFEKRSYILKRFESEALNNQALKLLNENTYAWVHIESLFSATVIPAIQKQFSIPIVVRTHNREAEIWMNNADETQHVLKKFYFSNLAKRLAKEELHLLGQAKALLHISTEDQTYFATLLKHVEHFYLPFTLPDIPQNAYDGKSGAIGFIGSMEWVPNQEGLNWFLLEAWPLIRKQFPEIKMKIAGKGLDKSEAVLQDIQGVEWLGEVENAAAFMLGIQALIVPLFSGSGIRIKTLEAMSLGVPVISTSKGAKGIEDKEQSGLLIADTAEEFVRQVLQVKKTEYALQMSNRSIDYIRTYHSSGRVVSVFKELEVYLTNTLGGQ